MAITPGPATAVAVVLAVLLAASVATLARLGVARDALYASVRAVLQLGPAPSSSWSCCWRWRRSRSR